MMMNNTIKNLCLLEELEASQKLIFSGFGELQEINMGNDFYYLPQQLLSMGSERFMKCYICLVYEARESRYPDTKFLKSLSHDLQKLKQTITDNYFSTNGIPLLEGDFKYIKEDKLLGQIVSVLSEFGKQARYYNLNIVTGSNEPPINPKEKWEQIESKIEDATPYLATGSLETLHRDYYPKVTSKIIAKLERFARAIALQFTLGKHGGQLQQFSPILDNLIRLKDGEFGQKDYRRSVKILQKNKEKWNKRSKSSVLSSRYPSRLVRKDQFDRDWPFRSEEVIVECRDRLFCIVNINGYDFALNGAAKSKFGYPDPHDMGLAILGKSIGPFIDMAFELTMDDKER